MTSSETVERSPAATEATARKAFQASIMISAGRCLVTYVLLPVLGPILGLTGAVGPVVGLLVGAVSAVAIVFSIRRFWAADSRWKWAYTVVGVAILVLLAVQAVSDIAALAG
jgi:hypothetical protein